MAGTGKKAQGQPHPIGKLVVPRHSKAGKRGLRACEKAVETTLRQAGKKFIRNWKKEY